MPDRRSFFQRIAALPLMAGFSSSGKAAPKPSRDYLKDLGVRTFINAAGTYTKLSASLMPPEVVDAIAATSRHYVALPELQDKVGARIAEMLKSEAAMVTSGAAGALTCGTAACITGTDEKAILQLPDLTGLKNEVLVQRSHRYAYDHSVRAVGVRMVEIESTEELERAVNNRTAMMLFFNDAEPRGQIKAAEWVALGKKHKIPTFNDASADVPPVHNLTKYTTMGFDLVTFSGGKGLCGPQSAGILAGRKDLIAAARLNTSPFSDTLARGMKVNKEEMVGMLAALELFVSKDHEAEEKEWQRRLRTLISAVSDLPVSTEVSIPEIANHTPHLFLTWDPAQITISPTEVDQQMREGQPSIEVCPMTNSERLVFTVWMMQPGETEIVAKRLRAILKGKHNPTVSA